MPTDLPPGNPYAPPDSLSKPLADNDHTPPFVAISTTRLAALCFCTLGFYQIVWLYRQWRRIKEREHLNIYPMARALFGIFFCHALFRKMVAAGEQAGISPSPAAAQLATGWILLSLAGRLPDPYWLVGLGSFACLLPMQAYVNQINAKQCPDHERNDRFDGGDWAICGIGGVLLLMGVIGAFSP